MAKRERAIQVLVDDEQKKIISKAADIKGTSMATWARTLLLEEARKVIREQIASEMLHEAR